MRPSGDPPTVVYIGGAGRSGSTLLDNLLGSSPGWFSAGELRLVWSARQLWTHRCGCGRPLRECELWNAVLAQVGAVDLEWAATMERQMLRSRQAWRLARRRHAGGVNGSEEFAALTARLVQAISSVTGADVIVDSSKSPMGVALLTGAGVDTRAIQLVRDPRAIAWSWRRTRSDDGPVPFGRRAVSAAAGEWVVNNVAMEAVTTRARVPHLRIRYEDLVDEPSAALGAAASLAEVPFSAAVDGATATLAGNHTVAGNPSRFRTGTVELRRDDEWRERLSRRDWLITTAITAPLLPRYGYPIGAG